MSIFRRQTIETQVDYSPIAFIGAGSATGTSGPIPTGDALGDFLIRTGLRTQDSSAVSVAAGEGWIDPTGTNIVALRSGSGGAAGALAYKIVDTVGTEAGSAAWTNGQTIVTGLYTGVDPTSPILASDFSLGSGNTVSWPALTYNAPFAWVILTIRLFNGVTNVDPTGGLFTIRENGVRRALWDSNGLMTSFAGASATYATPGQWITTATAIRSQ